MNKYKGLDTALKETREFIAGLPSCQVSGPPERFSVFFSLDGRGLALSGEDAQNYRGIANRLSDAVKDSGLITKSQVEKMLQRAILNAVVFIDGSMVAPPEAVSSVIKDLEAGMRASPMRFGVYYPVTGFDHHDLPAHVGDYRISVFSAADFQQFSGPPPSSDDPVQRIRVREVVARDLGGNVLGRVVAYRELDALEPDAAQDTALRDLHATLEVVNFYSDLIPYNHACVSIPGDQDSVSITVPVLYLNTERFSIRNQIVGRWGELSLKALEDADLEFGLGYQRLNQLLKSRRTKVDQIVLASVRWAGRASASKQKGEAFLFYMIAIESLVLCDNDPRELSYRLRLRTARILGNDLRTRNQIFKTLGKLYTIRSKIVHDGFYEVTDSDLALMRSVAKRCILTLINEPEFQLIETPQQFGAWIEAKVME